MSQPEPPESPTDGLRAASQRKGSFLMTFRAVAWSFFGIRKGSGYEEDVQKLNPVHVIVAGVIAALCFVLTIIVAVRWVVSSGVAAS